MFFGTPAQGNFESVFIYDTSSSMVSVTNSSCTTCSTKYYNSETSNSAVLMNQTDYSNTTSYGDLTVNGTIYSDMACINATNAWSCTEKGFPIFAIEEMEGNLESNFAKADGVLGLGPPTGNKTYAGNNQTSYILALYEAKKISKPIVAWNLNYYDLSTSYVIIGTDAFANSGKQYTYPVDTSQNDKWTLDVTQLKYGDEIPLKVSLDTTAVIDSSYSYLGLPKQDYESFVT